MSAHYGDADGVAPPAAEDERDPTGESEAGLPYVSPAERELEAAETHRPAEVFAAAAAPAIAEPAAEPSEPADVAAPSPSGEPAHQEAVLTVSEKPANPRRGWWQRLIQS